MNNKNNKILKLTKKDFNESINSADKVLIKFGAVWCSPCKLLSKLLEDLVEIPEDSKIYSVDVDEEQELCEEFDIQAIPTLLFFKNGSLIKRIHGSMDKKGIEDLFKM